MEEHFTTGREEVMEDCAKRDSSGPGTGQVINCCENYPGPSRSTKLRLIFWPAKKSLSSQEGPSFIGLFISSSTASQACCSAVDLPCYSHSGFYSECGCHDDK